MAYNLSVPNTIYNIYGKSLTMSDLNADTLTATTITGTTINGTQINQNGQPVPTIATTDETNTGSSTTKAICPLTATQLGYQSFNKQHGIFYGFSGSYSTGATQLNTTNGSQWYTTGITIPSAGIITLNSLGRKSTYSIVANVQSNMTTSGQRFDLKIQNLNTGPSDPIVRSNTYLLTSGSSTTVYTSLLSGLVDINNAIVDLIIAITNINLNGGSAIVLGNATLMITEL